MRRPTIFIVVLAVLATTAFFAPVALAQDWETAYSNFLPALTSAGRGPTSLSLADLNSDGTPELIAFFENGIDIACVTGNTARRCLPDADERGFGFASTAMLRKYRGPRGITWVASYAGKPAGLSALGYKNAKGTMEVAFNGTNASADVIVEQAKPKKGPVEYFAYENTASKREHDSARKSFFAGLKPLGGNAPSAKTAGQAGSQLTLSFLRLSQKYRTYATVKSVKLNKTKLPLKTGKSFQLVATLKPISAAATVTWQSDDSRVATVDAMGLVKAMSSGTARVTATLSSGHSAACTVQVTGNPVAIPVTGVSISHSSIELIENQGRQLSATVQPDNASNPAVVWESSNPSVAAVGNSGYVTAKKVGSATITVRAVDGGHSAACAVNVKAKTIPVSGVSVSLTSLDLKVGNTQQLSATVQPKDATNKRVSWSSSNAGVASVADGLVRAIGAGEATITVKSEDGGHQATCKVKVTEPFTWDAGWDIPKKLEAFQKLFPTGSRFNAGTAITPSTPVVDLAGSVTWAAGGGVNSWNSGYGNSEGDQAFVRVLGYHLRGVDIDDDAWVKQTWDSIEAGDFINYRIAQGQDNIPVIVLSRSGDTVRVVACKRDDAFRIDWTGTLTRPYLENECYSRYYWGKHTPPVADFSPTWPVPGEYTISTLTKYSDGNTHSTYNENPWWAIDIAADAWDPIVAVEAGEVISVVKEPGGGFGNYVRIRHYDDKASVSLYAHMIQLPLVTKGQKVNRGDVIGYVGKTGLANGYHLHFELSNYNAYAQFYRGNYNFSYILGAAKYGQS